jgi:hypothetical protein
MLGKPSGSASREPAKYKTSVQYNLHKGRGTPSEAEEPAKEERQALHQRRHAAPDLLCADGRHQLRSSGESQRPWGSEPAASEGREELRQRASTNELLVREANGSAQPRKGGYHSPIIHE